MGGSANFFTRLVTIYDTNLMASVNGVIGSGLAWAQGPMRGAAVLFVLITGWLVLTGRMDKSIFAGRVIRIMGVAALLTAANFNVYVRDLFLNDLPASIGGALSGSAATAPATQFDALWSATQLLAADFIKESNGWTQMGERFMIRLFMYISFIALVVVFVIWLVVRVIMGMVIAFGPFLIGLWLFDTTRPFVQRWAGKLVSLTLVQVSIGVMLQFIASGYGNYVRAIQAGIGPSTDERIVALLQVSLWYWCGVLLISVLASVSYSIGGGLASSFTPIAQSASGSVDTTGRVGGRLAGAAGRGAVGGARAVGRVIRPASTPSSQP